MIIIRKQNTKAFQQNSERRSNNKTIQCIKLQLQSMVFQRPAPNQKHHLRAWGCQQLLFTEYKPAAQENTAGCSNFSWLSSNLKAVYSEWFHRMAMDVTGNKWFWNQIRSWDFVNQAQRRYFLQDFSEHLWGEDSGIRPTFLILMSQGFQITSWDFSKMPQFKESSRV